MKQLFGIKNILLIASFFVVGSMAFAQQPQPPAQPKFMGEGTQRFFQFMTDEIDFSKLKVIGILLSLAKF